AFLSKVAQELYRVLTTTTMIKDDIEYHDVFTGKDAVDRLVHILRTTDRNLALLMGRSLDDQNFFNDVNYEHKLRDSSEELYRFRDTAGVPVSAETEEKKNDLVLEHDIELPNGVFTLLTECYSPT
ncbi:uncharacterized protein BYT42DRAFT_464951, partial [Radiomyces spectabilis]|uniref:uncharacterized protein n=1 Tax=Radiomyces spectabilis TaxID=64574 RepID=UPI00221F4E15